MIKFKRFQAFAIVLLAGLLVGAAADRAISRRDVQAMSDGERNRQVRQDLLSILLPSNSLYSSNRLALKGDAWLQVRASATPYRSLCQRDTLSLYYETTDRSGNYEDWRALPYAIGSSRSYRFVTTPTPAHFAEDEVAEEPRSVFDRECRGADQVKKDDQWNGWFTADSPELAMQGGFAMLALADWVKQPGNRLSDCIDAPDAGECNSRADYVMTLDFIGAVEVCPESKPDVICFALGKYIDLFTIRARKTGKPMRAEDILSVGHDENIIVT